MDTSKWRFGEGLFGMTRDGVSDAPRRSELETGAFSQIWEQVSRNGILEGKPRVRVFADD